MKVWFSSDTKGFYTSDINGETEPKNSLEISIERYEELLQGHAQGMQIAADESGFPVLVVRPVIEQPTEQTPMV